MANYFILAQSDVTALALGAWLELLGEPPFKGLEDRRLLISRGSSAIEKYRGIATYEVLIRMIESRVIEQQDDEAIVLVDCIKPIDINPLNESCYWDHLIGKLILTFPEIRWVFGLICNDQPEHAFPRDYHSLLSPLVHPRRDPLFDGTGLRNFVRQTINSNFIRDYAEKLNKASVNVNKQLIADFEKSLLSTRLSSAAAIDEEMNYSLFHAYVAYRFGYRADAVRSWALMKQLFSDHSASDETHKLASKKDDGHGFGLLLEDVNLNFPDKEEKIHLSTFALFRNDGQPGRATNCPLLLSDNSKENSVFRIIVTSGHSGADADKMKDNREFVEAYKGKERSGFVLKPVGGMFDLWKEAKLFKRLNPRVDSASAGRYRGQAPGFYWPPKPSEQAEETGGHSAPGKLMLIAQHLLRRADAMRTTANTVEECIRGAVLATDALELLRYQTPTLALQALCLKHEFEVKSEVAFLGVGHHFDLKQRFNELEREIKHASRFFEAKRRKAAEYDTLVSIGNRLMLVFREAGQFDEEMECLTHIRSWHRKLRRRQARNPVTIVANSVMGYAEWLLASPVHFFGALVFWYALLVILCWVGTTNKVVYSASVAWNAFTAGEPKGPTANSFEFVFHVIASASGLFHFGVFISYLYSSVTRK